MLTRGKRAINPYHESQDGNSQTRDVSLRRFREINARSDCFELAKIRRSVRGECSGRATQL